GVVNGDWASAPAQRADRQGYPTAVRQHRTLLGRDQQARQMGESLQRSHQGVLDRCPVLELLDADRILDRESADPRPAERYDLSPDPKVVTDVASDGTNVGPARAVDLEIQFRRGEPRHLDPIDGN